MIEGKTLFRHRLTSYLFPGPTNKLHLKYFNIWQNLPKVISSKLPIMQKIQNEYHVFMNGALNVLISWRWSWNPMFDLVMCGRNLKLQDREKFKLQDRGLSEHPNRVRQLNLRDRYAGPESWSAGSEIRRRFSCFGNKFELLLCFNANGIQFQDVVQPTSVTRVLFHSWIVRAYSKKVISKHFVLPTNILPKIAIWNCYCSFTLQGENIFCFSIDMLQK